MPGRGGIHRGFSVAGDEGFRGAEEGGAVRLGSAASKDRGSFRFDNPQVIDFFRFWVCVFFLPAEMLELNCCVLECCVLEGCADLLCAGMLCLEVLRAGMLCLVSAVYRSAVLNEVLCDALLAF